MFAKVAKFNIARTKAISTHWAGISNDDAVFLDATAA
jgi:hypothetical protein